MDEVLVEDLPVPEFLKRNLRDFGVVELYPPQVKALQAGVLAGENIVLATPTASGKTLVALMAASIHLVKGGKVLYLVPLRALASEKFEDCKRLLCRGTGFKAAISTGDYDSSDPWLADYDVIVATNEKADSLLRHRAPWINDVSLIVFDELHLLGDPDRGPTLEMVITKLRRRLPGAQLIGLSATISNADEVAGWLNAKPVVSDWRPVPLKEGVLLGGRIEFPDGSIWELKQMSDNVIVNAVLNIVAEGGQALVFALTRSRAESYAARIAKDLSERIDLLAPDDREALEEYAEKILATDRSSFSENLAQLVVRGAAFHHAGLSHAQRSLIEEAFRARRLKAVVATPTLAAGVNLPARLVLITEVRRYQPGYGYQLIPVLEYKQFCGRAGRPGYDEVGYSAIIARRNDEKEYFMRRYVQGEPERIRSELASEKHLRFHVLALVASEEVATIDGLLKLFDETFLAHIYGAHLIEEELTGVLGFLESAGLLEVYGLEVRATPLGRRVSELYIDPMTAIRLLEAFREAGRVSSFGLLHSIALTPDIPRIPMKRLSPRLLEEEIERRAEGLMIQPLDPGDEAYDEYVDAFRMALVLEAWVEEVPEAEIYERFGVQPGDLAILREAASWIAYAASQIAKVAGYREFVKPYDIMSERIKHGVKEELIPLARLRGIGRVRARLLYQHGYTSLEKLRAASPQDLMRIPGIGPAIVKQIMEQL
ncbi:MAG: DEAD/DEAH box helicase [Aigarchaeota archaeon]|nr:DEAD/DEAH box helicase [Candidatus Wolframiiraptor gerlachensis]